jgi:hypothetical protein
LLDHSGELVHDGGLDGADGGGGELHDLSLQGGDERGESVQLLVHDGDVGGILEVDGGEGGGCDGRRWEVSRSIRWEGWARIERGLLITEMGWTEKTLTSETMLVMDTTLETTLVTMSTAWIGAAMAPMKRAGTARRVVNCMVKIGG